MATNLSADILVVEDDPTIGRLLRDIFALAGRATRVAPSVADAAAELRRARPALLTLDLNLPGASGQDLLQQLRRRPETRGLPVIVITSQLPVTADVSSLVDAVVAKPFDLSELLAAVDRVLPGAARLAA